MKKKLWVTCLCLLGAVVLLNGCAGKYADVKKLNSEFVNSMETYVADLDRADSAKEVAAAMNRYADRLEKIWPKLKAQSEKYSELKDRDQVPEELKESEKHASEVGMKMAASFRKIIPHMGDPEVVKAQQRIGNIMSEK